MYIEDKSLNDKHAEIKFMEGSTYIFKDCNSDSGKSANCSLLSGSWTKINELDLYKESRDRNYMVGPYLFVIEESK